MNTRRRWSTALGIVSIVGASMVFAGKPAMAEDQPQGEAQRVETRQETTQTARYTEQTITTFGRGVTGDVFRPPANQLWPEYTERERLWYNLSQMPGS